MAPLVVFSEHVDGPALRYGTGGANLAPERIDPSVAVIVLSNCHIC